MRQAGSSKIPKMAIIAEYFFVIVVSFLELIFLRGEGSLVNNVQIYYAALKMKSWMFIFLNLAFSILSFDDEAINFGY